MKWTTDEFTGKRFGKYEVLCRVAVGGMAEIFLGFAHQGQFVGRPVVLKRILAEQREDPAAMQMLLDEAKVTATLAHPNVAQVLDLELAGEDVLLVIEFIQGANVEELVEAHTQTGEPVPLGLALAIVRDSAQGLANAHAHKDAAGKPQPVIHRDVTPRNLMVNFEGVTKVLDFGIARAMGSARRTVAGMVRGTTAYMSPEQAIGKDLDPRSDLFSLGTIFHELLTGQRLFAKGNPALEMAAVYEQEIVPPSKANRRVPKAIDPVVMRALDRKREARYQSAQELARDLTQAAGSAAWTKERCGEVIRERFQARLQDIERLVVKVPRLRSSAPEAPPYPQGKAPAGAPKASSPPRPLPALLDSGEHPELKTVIQQGPLVNPPGPERPTDEMSRSTDKGPAAKPELSEEQLFGDLGDEAEATRIIPGASMRGLRQVPGKGAAEEPTAQRRRARPDASNLPLIIAVVLALVAGVGVGAYVMGGAPRASGLSKLSIATDRPVEVLLGGNRLGKTPLSNVFVPAGPLSLQLLEEDGTVRRLELDVVADQPVDLSVALDSLAKVP